MKLFLIAGEASGDMHGSELVKAIKDIEGGIEFVGVGGERMEEAGVRLLHNPVAVSNVGFVENISKLPYYLRLLKRVFAWIDSENPDLVIFVDFPGFNLKVADYCKTTNRRCVYYIPPTAWVWGRERAFKVAETTDLVISLFPFEAELYRKSGANVKCLGHPLVDIVKRSRDRGEVRRELGFSDSQQVVGLMPGSRKLEINMHLGLMLDAASDIRNRFPDTGFILPVASTVDRNSIEKEIAKRKIDVKIVKGHNYDYMGACDVLAVALGTATLEAALLNIPMVIVYKLSFLSRMIIKRLVKIEHAGLPNIIAGRLIVPELINENLSREHLASELMRMLESEEYRERLKKELKDAVRSLGEGGSIQKAAQAVVDLLAAE